MPYAIAPELASGLEPLYQQRDSGPSVAVHDIETRRANFNSLIASIKTRSPLEGVLTNIYSTKTTDGHDLKMYWFYKRDVVGVPGPAVIHSHGGGMIMGGVMDTQLLIAQYVSQSEVPWLSIEFRNAPEHPHPTPVEDCYTGLTWLRDNAKKLNVDPMRIGIIGESGGGCIAAGVALMARKRKFAPPLAKLILIYPMLDDRNTVVDKELLPWATWDYDSNMTGWSALLGKGVPGSEHVSEYAAPTRADDLTGLPPTYIDVGELDIFRDEDIQFASRLAVAKVSIELHVHPGCPHAWEMFVPASDVAKRAIADRVRALKSF